MEKTKKNDFIELLYTGYLNGKVFDSNVAEDLKTLNPQAKPQKLIISIGQGMVVPGLDKALEDKEINKDYEIQLKAKEGFGERDRNLMKTIPLKVFTEQKIDPRAGMVLQLDNSIAKIISISGARVMTDFNNPLAGKDISYKFKISRIITDEREKVSSIFENLLKFVPEFDITESSVTIKGPQAFEIIAKTLKDKFKELLNKELSFKLEEKKPEKKSEEDKKKEVKDDNKEISEAEKN